MIRYCLTVCFSIMLTSPALAGIMVDETLSCPIGGQEFETKSTMSCSTMGRMISMQPITSCDFITRLPQCPKNKLPMYKEFTDADLVELKSFMRTAAYKDGASYSRYYLAYFIDRELTSGSEATQFYLLQQGLWYTAESQKNEDYLRAYHASLDAALTLEEFEGKTYWRGAQAWIALENNNLAMAKHNIEIMKSENKDNDEYLATYISALSYCLKAAPNDELCTSHTSLTAHEETKPEK